MLLRPMRQSCCRAMNDIGYINVFALRDCCFFYPNSVIRAWMDFGILEVQILWGFLCCWGTSAGRDAACRVRIIRR